MRSIRSAAGAIALAAVVSAAQAQTVITFDGLEHGRIITNQFDGLGVTITADNFNRAFDLAAIFDSNRPSDPNDPDLLFPWDRGNLVGTRLGNVMILAENNTGAGDGVLDNPDDEGSRPAGTFTIDFASPVSYFGLDIVDVEGTMQENGFLRFFRNGVAVGTVSFSDFEDNASAYFDASVDFGDNSANRLGPIYSSDFGTSGFDRVVVRLGGSGAIDNLVFPAPGASVVLAGGLLAMTRRRR